MIKTVRALNIDKSRPIVEKRYNAMTKCSKCGIKSELKLKIIANERELIIGAYTGKCETKMRGVKNATVCGNTIKWDFKVAMPKGK